jgi:hypothetical protein
MSCVVLSLVVLGLIAGSDVVAAQTVVGVGTRGLARDVTALGSGTRSTTAGAPAMLAPSRLVLLKDRSRTLGTELSASRTRIDVVTDADLRGLSPEAALTRLTPPPVAATDHVRTVEVVVALTHPWTVRASAPDQPLTLGTIVASGPAARHLVVDTVISAPRLTVVGAPGHTPTAARTSTGGTQ